MHGANNEAPGTISPYIFIDFFRKSPSRTFPTMKAATVVFRVDGGHIPGVSFGHLFRCLRLAEELRTRRICSVFAIKRDAKGVGLITRHGFELVTIGPELSREEERERLLEATTSSSIRSIIFDLPSIRQHDIQGFPDHVKTVVIDDTGQKDIVPNLLINGSIVEKFHAYPRHQQTRYCIGHPYSILGEQFEHIPARQITQHAATVTVFFGGSDPRNLTEWVIDSLKDMNPPLTMRLILGPGYQELPSLAERISASRSPITITRNAPDIAQCFLQTDIAITAGGMTLYELGATGTPALCIPSIEHEHETAQAFERLGTVKNLGMWTPDHIRRVPEALEALQDDYPLRQKMSVAGQQTIDGLGRQRVADCIEDCLFHSR